MAEVEVPAIEGDPIRMGGRTLSMPALNLGQLERLADQVQIAHDLIAQGLNPWQLTREQINALAALVHAALERNYPNVSLAEVKESIDMRNLLPTILALMGRSGFPSRPPMAAAAAGASADGGTPTSTGNGSTESFAPPSAGPSTT